MLHLHRDPRASSSNENGVGIENQQERKEGHNFNRRKGKKEGGREGRKGGRKGGRQEERNKGRAPKWCALWTCYFQSCRFQAICKCRFQNVAKTVQFTDFSRNTLQTPCRYVQSANDNFNILRSPTTYRFELQKVVRIASNLPTSISKRCACHAVYQ